MINNIEIQFSPLIDEPVLTGLTLLTLLLLILMSIMTLRHKGAQSLPPLILRSLTLGALLLALWSPTLLREERQSLTDVALILIDQSPSQKIEERTAQTQKALANLKERFKAHENLELRLAYTPPNPSETQITAALDEGFSGIPPKRRAGVIILSDGQIHDLPANPAYFEEYGPIHLLLSGHKNERDRKITLLQTPLYGITSQEVKLTYKIEQTPNITAKTARVTLNQAGQTPQDFLVPINEPQSLTLPIDHAGQNVFTLFVEPVSGELTERNNHATLLINGVRDRLRVLLVSGKPHTGGRTWRDLLTSDPGIDLVHFTILREPGKLDATPQSELSLIAFPFRELFETKLYDFDLIIFDQYELNRVLPYRYFENIVRFVKEGGAFLAVNGPAFSGAGSINLSPLREILPAQPTGEILNSRFRPSITNEGAGHPVTRDLAGSSKSTQAQNWGSWQRQIGVLQKRGAVLMTGAQNTPLLLLDHVEQGRVAQLSSDQLWLWARGYDGGGPHIELARRIVHWLMKEPELDERAIEIRAKGQEITLRQPDYQNPVRDLLVQAPDGTKTTLRLEQRDKDKPILSAHMTATQTGLYIFEERSEKLRTDAPPEHTQRYFVNVGMVNPPEQRDILSTPDILAPLIKDRKGGIFRMENRVSPQIRYQSLSKNMAGSHWIALKRSNSFEVSGLQSRPLLPPWAWAFMLVALALITWWREGRS